MAALTPLWGYFSGPGIMEWAALAFGDNMNDIDLLETAGYPFMMNNANPDLIDRLPHVPRIGNNFEAGVARHCRAVSTRQNRARCHRSVLLRRLGRRGRRSWCRRAWDRGRRSR